MRNMSPDRQARLGENEAIMRSVNETVAGVAKATAMEPAVFLCECAAGCGDSVRLTREAYEAVRAVPDHFFVTPGHVSLDVERVIEKHSHYWVVEKFGIAAEVAEAADPRS